MYSKYFIVIMIYYDFRNFAKNVILWCVLHIHCLISLTWTNVFPSQPPQLNVTCATRMVNVWLAKIHKWAANVVLGLLEEIAKSTWSCFWSLDVFQLFSWWLSPVEYHVSAVEKEAKMTNHVSTYWKNYFCNMLSCNLYINIYIYIIESIIKNLLRHSRYGSCIMLYY